MPEIIYAKLGASDAIALRQGDIVAIGASLDALAKIKDLIGPEVSDAAALNVPIGAAEVLVTSAEATGKELVEFRNADFVGQVAIHHIERGGVPLPLGLHVKLQRSDVLFVAGMKAGVDRFAATMGRIARASTSADLATLALGMVLGLALGAAGLGNAVGLLASGAIAAALSSRIGWLGRPSNAARDIVEKLGLVVFIAIVGIDAGTALGHLSAELALKMVAAGLLVSTLPPIAVWALGLHAMKMNAAILAGAVAGARSHAECAREAAEDMDSSVPWIGFPVAYAVSGVLLTLFGYAATVLSS
jgi:putative transport protein